MSTRKHLAIAPMEQILKAAGAPRVGEDAKEALREYLEEEALRIGALATELAQHANRRTVRAEDIKLAIKR